MKNITQYLFIALAIVFASSSCTVQKRLHNPGYHVQLNSKVKVDKSADKDLKVDEELALSETKTAETSLPELEATEKVNPATLTVTEIGSNFNADIASNDESMSFQKTNTSKRSLIQAKPMVEKQPVQVEKKALKIDKKAEKNAAGNASGGVALVVLVILCLFPLINLIPVYITDGGITLNFWVTLILNLTYIGAVIFSLLVVLGVVSLA